MRGRAWIAGRGTGCGDVQEARRSESRMWKGARIALKNTEAGEKSDGSFTLERRPARGCRRPEDHRRRLWRGAGRRPVVERGDRRAARQDLRAEIEREGRSVH